MAQAHGDRLTAVDASFLAQESDTSHMHVGAVTIFEGPAPARGLRAHIRARLHLVPRYRQRLAFPPLETGRPLWVDDPTFHLDYHVRHTALPAPGAEAQLRAMAARIVSQQLDRSKPLWEMWLVEGLEDGAVRADLQDPPRARSTAWPAWTSRRCIFDLEPGAARRSRTRRRPGSRARAVRPSWPPAASAGWCEAARARRAGGRRRRAAEPRRWRSRGRPRKASARSSGPA